MVSRITTVLFSYIAMVMVRAQQTPIEPSEPCLYADCGVEVISLTPKNSDSPQKYQILSKIDGSIYIGGLQEFIKIDPTCDGNGTDPWMQRSDQIKRCTGGQGAGLPCESLVSTNPTLICDNYIRIVEEVNGKLLVCGTGSAFPRCYSFDKSCALTSDGDLTGGSCSSEESYQAHNSYNVAPRNWDQNTTLGYFGGDVFVGSTSSISTDDSFVGKVEVAGIIGDFNTGLFGDRVDTATIEARSVNEANFVGHPYEYTSEDGDEYVLFFFRETAVEHINQGKIVYSRVARVCKNDIGNGLKWSSYLKARLNCSRPGEYPEYLDEIQDVVVSEINGKVYFYAAFTQPENAPPQSAICIFSLDDIHNVFQTSKFKSSASANSLWLPLDDGDVPVPRPGFSCGAPSTDTTFLANTPLMNDLVENFNYKTKLQLAASDFPLFFHNGARFSRIAVHKMGSSFADSVMFIGTETGEVWKVTDAESNTAITVDEDFHIVKLWQSTDGSPITGVEWLESNGETYLYATTHDKIMKINLQHGKAQTKSQFNLIYPPYLTANPVNFEATNVVRPHKMDVTLCDNREVMILCEGNLDPTINMRANATWKFKSDFEDTASKLEDTDLGHLIQYEIPRSDVANPLSYIVIKTHNRTSGEYTCSVAMGDETEESETSTIEVKICLTDLAVKDRMAYYDEQKMQSEDSRTKFQDYGTCDVEPVPCDEACPWTFNP